MTVDFHSPKTLAFLSFFKHKDGGKRITVGLRPSSSSSSNTTTTSSSLLCFVFSFASLSMLGLGGERARAFLSYGLSSNREGMDGLVAKTELRETGGTETQFRKRDRDRERERKRKRQRQRQRQRGEECNA